MPESGLLPNMVSGNPEVIELLEAYLETAKQHPFGHIAIAMTGHPGIAAADFAGEISLEESCREALGILTRKVGESIASWTLPPKNEQLDKSYVVYNVANGPIGWDFAIWLIDAEMTRIRSGAPGPLCVSFFMGRNAEARLSRRDKQAWVDNVFRPLVAMIGAVEDNAALHGHNKPVFVTRDIVAAAKAGEKVPRFRPRHPVSMAKQPVTITLREAEHWPHRNSDLAAWTKFADDLIAQGERVIFLRDTAKAQVPLIPHIHVPFETAPGASTDLHERCALYAAAKANLFVSNGPASLAIFGERPWLQFVTLEPDGSGFAPNTEMFWKKQAGIAPGDQYPWSSPQQRMVWAADTYENIVKAWDELKLP